MSTNTNRFRPYFIILLSLWTLLMWVHYIVQYNEYRQSILEIATKEADLTYLKDSLYRRWVSMHGGVYVPVDEQTPPNPYLSHIPDRDIETADGKKLTLVNPAYMTRQVFEMAGDGVIQGHLTSDKLLNPINKPDKWEEKALRAVMSGSGTFSGRDTISGEPYLRFMRPFVTDESCLKCHEHQGYKVGDVRGGISVKVPLNDYYNIFKSKSGALLTVNITVWLFGLVLLFYTYLKLSTLMKKEEQMSREKDMILQELNHRVKNNLQIISSIIDIHLSKTCSHDKDEVLRDIQQRLVSMSNLHSMFVSDNNMVAVESVKYIRNILESFTKTNVQNSGTEIGIMSEIDDFNISAKQAMSCGLILNELLTNSFKYAFDGSSGQPSIMITFRRSGDNAVLTYEDNGIGFDYDKAVEKNGSFGFMLISSMAEKIEAQMSISGKKGMSARFEFRVNHKKNNKNYRDRKYAL